MRSILQLISNKSKYLKEYLVNPEAFVMKYHSVPGGVLLFGSADAGKVSLARALATEAEASLLMITPSRIQAWTSTFRVLCPLQAQVSSSFPLQVSALSKEKSRQ